MSIGDYGYKVKMGCTSMTNTHSSVLADLSINPFASALFSSKFKWEGVPQVSTVSKGKGQSGPTRSQILGW